VFESTLFSNEWFGVDNSMIHFFVNEIFLVKNDETDDVWNGLLPNATLEKDVDGVELVLVVVVDVDWGGIDDALVVSKKVMN